MADIEFQGSDYIPPRAAVVIGSLLRGPREIGHSVQFSDLFSDVQEEQRAYFDGLSSVPIIFGSLFLAWAFVTILLKCKGEEVGCASGRAFVSLPSEDEDEENLEKPEGELSSTSSESNGESSDDSGVKPLFAGPDGFAMLHSDSDVKEEKEHCGKKLLKCIKRNREKEDADSSGINKLARGTRLSFLFFASVALVCAPLCIVLTFGPLREVVTTESPTGLVPKIQTVVEEMAMSLDTIQSLSADALELIDTVPTDLDVVCPLVNIKDLEATVGVDITEIVEVIIDQQSKLEDEVAAQLAKKQSYMDGIQERMSTFEAISDETENYLWILPGLLLSIIALTVIAMVGVILAWRGKTGTRFQRLLTYGVLPLLILVSIVSWGVVMTFAFSTMVGTDICLSDSFEGSPDETIHAILASKGNGTEGTLHHFASTYVIDCEANDPSKEISQIKSETQDQIDNIWRQVSKIDSVGRVMAIERCGDTEEFTKMLSGARDLAMILTEIRRSLSSLEETTSCDYILPIYTEVTEDIVCTEALRASAYGFITFLIIWICVMAMISMRASWLKNNTGGEEKNYHDDDEVAENMIVDEHEEYLAYISKYKHEWQEYEGFEEDKVSTPSARLSGSPGTSGYYYGDDEEEIIFDDSKDDVSTLDGRTLDTRTYCCRDCDKPQQGAGYCVECNPLQERPIVYQRKLTTREIMDHQDDGVSYASGEISFASLSSAIKSDVLNPESILVLPPPMNPDYTEEDAEEEQQDEDKNMDTYHTRAGYDIEKILDDLEGGEEVEVQLYAL